MNIMGLELGGRKSNGHALIPYQGPPKPVDLDAEFKAMKAEQFAPKQRTRTVAVVYEEIVLNNEQVALLIREARERLALVATVLVPEFDTLVAAAKAEHSKQIQELEAVEASIPRASVMPEGQPI